MTTQRIRILANLCRLLVGVMVLAVAVAERSGTVLLVLVLLLLAVEAAGVVAEVMEP